MELLRATHLKFLLVLFISLISGVSCAQSSRQVLIDSAESLSNSLNYQQAIFIYEDVLKISKQKKQSKNIIIDLLAIGQTYSDLDEIDKAIEHFLMALKGAEKMTGGDSLEFESLMIVSYSYMRLKDLERAQKYLYQSKKITEKIHQPYYYHHYYNHLGILERKKDNFKASINAYKRALKLIPDSLLKLGTLGTLGISKIKCLNNIATAYSYEGRKKTAHYYLLEAQKLNETVKDDYCEMVLCGQIGVSHLHLGNLQEAKKYFLLAYETAQKSNNSQIIRRMQSELAGVNYKLGNYKEAYDYYHKLLRELRIYHEREAALAVAEMSVKYEHDKNQERIKNLEERQVLKAKIHKSQIERRNLWVFVVIIVLFVTIVSAIIVFKNQRNKQRLKLELAEKQKELVKQQSELKGQEVERNRLSRELHDGLGGTLASIKMRLSSKNSEELSPILKDIDAACQDVRNMSHSLSSSFIEGLSFYELLVKLSEDLRQRSDLVVNLEFMPKDELNSLASETRHQCYRIIQELSNNVLKHAHAKALTIGLMKNEDEVILLLEDNGTGFDTTAVSSGIGMNNVQKRLESIGGHLEIISKQNEGSTFSINFPFKSVYEI